MSTLPSFYKDLTLSKVLKENGIDKITSEHAYPKGNSASIDDNKANIKIQLYKAHVQNLEESCLGDDRNKTVAYALDQVAKGIKVYDHAL